MSMYKEALKTNLTYFINGTITTEDLWQCSINELKKYVRELHKTIKELNENDLFVTTSEVDKILQLRFDIVMDVISDKLNDSIKLENEIKIKEQRQLLLGLKHKKQMESLENLTEEELNKRLDEL